MQLSCHKNLISRERLFVCKRLFMRSVGVYKWTGGQPDGTNMALTLSEKAMVTRMLISFHFTPSNNNIKLSLMPLSTYKLCQIKINGFKGNYDRGAKLKTRNSINKQFFNLR